MKSNKKKKFSLIEIFAAISIMVIISAVLMGNFKSSINKGKAFRSREGAKQIYNALHLSAAENYMSIEDAASNAETVLKGSPLISRKSNSNDPLNDGWGEPYVISVEDGDISVRSEHLESYTESEGLSSEQEEYWKG